MDGCPFVFSKVCVDWSTKIKSVGYKFIFFIMILELNVDSNFCLNTQWNSIHFDWSLKKCLSHHLTIYWSRIQDFTAQW
jgi:hypothetical protein